jgi:short-subunit dehydrogenase
MTGEARRTVLVTGASSGIGEALAHCCARDGHDVVLAARSIDKLERLAATLRERHGIQAIAIHADLESIDGARQLHADIRARGLGIDILINNAGYGLYGEFSALPLDAQLAMMQLNMTSLVALSKLFLSDLVERRGRLMNVASTAAFQPGPYMAVYYATKAFVLSFSEALAEELSESGVGVTAFCPGPTASGFQDKAVMHDSALVKGRRLPGSAEIAELGWRALLRGQRVYIPGRLNWLMAQSNRFAPRRVVTRVVKFIGRPTPAN